MVRRTHKRPARARKRRPKIRATESPGWKIFDWFAVVLGAIVILVGGISALVGPESEPHRQAAKTTGDRIMLQLFNGAGDKSAVAILSDSLRAMGIDVGDEVRNSRSVYPYTILLDRKGNPQLMDSLATILGLPHDRIVLQRNKNIYDATLVVGKDYKQILKKVLEKNQ